MGKNKEGINGIIQKLAMVSENLYDFLPEAKSVVVFSLNEKDFQMMKTQVNDFSSNEQFKIDISGIEFIFLSDKLLSKSEDNS